MVKKKEHKRVMLLLILVTVVLFTVEGCKKNSESKKKSIELNVESYIQDAIDKANLMAGIDFLRTEEGEYYSWSSPSAKKELHNYVYSYFGKNIKMLRKSVLDEVLAVREDGSLYNGNTLITDEYEVKDILWTTNNIGVDAYIITKSGEVLYFNPSASPDKQYGEVRLNSEEEIKNIVSGCRYRHSTIFLDKKGKMYANTGDDWDKCKIDGWKDVAVMACTQNEDDGTVTIAAIAADGTVYATGDYAEEILSWGELAYITMGDDLIVGLKKDGTLAFAGKKAEVFAKEKLKNVQAVRVFDDEFMAMLEDGYAVAEIERYDSGDMYYINAKEPTRDSVLYTDKSGNMKVCKNGVWHKSSLAPAVAGAENALIYFAELGEEKIKWGSNFSDGTYTAFETDRLNYQLADVDGDKTKEIFLENYAAGSADGMTGFGCLYNGELRVLLTGAGVNSYYPEKGVICSSGGHGGIMSTQYYKYENGSIKRVVKEIYDMNTETTEYVAYNEYVPKEESDESETNQRKNSEEEVKIEKEEFDEIIYKLVGNTEMKTLDSKYIENTKENRITSFLSDLEFPKEKIEEDEKSLEELSNPIVKGDDIVEWDAIYFGKYWANDNNGDGVADKKDEKEPIKWRILSLEGNTALLLAENAIYAGEKENTAWRKEILNNAFNENEIKALQQKNKDGDKVFLLDDVTNEKFGFVNKLSKMCKLTGYSVNYDDRKDKKDVSTGWWTDKEDRETNYYWDNGVMNNKSVSVIVYVDSDGREETTKYHTTCLGIRPAIYLDLSDESLWTYAGTVSTEDYVEVSYK